MYYVKLLNSEKSAKIASVVPRVFALHVLLFVNCVYFALRKQLQNDRPRELPLDLAVGGKAQ